MSIFLEAIAAIVNLDTLETTVKQVCILKYFIRRGRFIGQQSAQPALWMVGFRFLGFFPLGVKSVFSFLLDELPTMAMSTSTQG